MARPDYIDALIDDVGQYAELVARAVEIGTGKATLAFASRGIAVTYLESHARIAALLATKGIVYSHVSVEVEPFATWIPTESYDLLVAPLKWHWVNPIRRWDLAYAARRDGGALALFWNRFALASLEAQSKLFEGDRRFGVHIMEPSTSPHPSSDFSEDVDVADGWPAFDLRTDARFGHFVKQRYRRTLSFNVSTFRDLLASLSAYRLLETVEQERLFDEIRSLFKTASVIKLAVATQLFVGRTVEPSFCTPGPLSGQPAPPVRPRLTLLLRIALLNPY